MIMLNKKFSLSFIVIVITLLVTSSHMSYDVHMSCDIHMSYDIHMSCDMSYAPCHANNIMSVVVDLVQDICVICLRLVYIHVTS